MAKKSVYASIEIADRDVRLVVVEMFNNRSNVLRVERADHSGISKGKITDEKSVVTAIEQVITQAQTALGYHIERVLLALTARGLKTVGTDVHVEIDDGTHTVRRYHLQQGLKTAMSAAQFDDLILVNVNRITYSIDGKQTGEEPLGFDTPAFDMHVDLLFADKETVFSYVKAVEKAGLKVMDIAIDQYAAAMETGSLIQSTDTPVIQIDLEADHTSLALLNKQKIVFCAVTDEGYRSFIAELREKYGLSEGASWRLLENLFDANEEESDDSVIYIEQQEDRRVEITKKELAGSVLPRIRSWIAEINAACSGILEKKNARYRISGEGSSIPVLKKMENAFNAPAEIYTVTSIGARNGAFVVPLGMPYAWETINRIKNSDTTSVNNNELEESIETITRYAKDQEGGFTKKLKRVMLTSKD